MQIGVLTGGGDCGGLNAAIRAVVIRAARGGHTVVGVHDGWKGMVEGRGAPLTVKDVASIVGLGALSLILILWSLIFSTPDVGSQGLVSGSTSRDIGVWLGLIATGALTYGAYLAMQEEGATYGGRGERQRRPRGERPRREPPPPSAPGP